MDFKKIRELLRTGIRFLKYASEIASQNSPNSDSEKSKENNSIDYSCAIKNILKCAEETPEDADNMLDELIDHISEIVENQMTEIKELREKMQGKREEETKEDE